MTLHDFSFAGLRGICIAAEASAPMLKPLPRILVYAGASILAMLLNKLEGIEEEELSSDEILDIVL